MIIISTMSPPSLGRRFMLCLRTAPGFSWDQPRAPFSGRPEVICLVQMAFHTCPDRGGGGGGASGLFKADPTALV